MRCLAITLVACLAALPLAACDRDDNPPVTNTVVVDNTSTVEYTYKDCPNGGTVRSNEPCPTDTNTTKQP